MKPHCLSLGKNDDAPGGRVVSSAVGVLFQHSS